MGFIVTQFLTGLAGSASLFLTAAGLTVIFGVSRIVNFAHGSLVMLGAYIGWTILTHLPRDPGWFVTGVLLAALSTGLIGMLLERLLIRHLYRSAELFQLLATFGLMLIIQDLTLLVWGPGDLTISRPHWLRSFIGIAGVRFPQYDLALIVVSPLVLGLILLLLLRTRFGVLVRACTENRDMAAALGVDQKTLSTLTFGLGAGLAGLGGALMLPDGSANLQIDLTVVVEAFVVVVIGGLGSITGAFLAAILIGELQAFGIVLVPKATLVMMFVLMALVLAVRPTGLLGASQAQAGARLEKFAAARPLPRPVIWAAWAVIAVMAAIGPWLSPQWRSLATELMVAANFAGSLFLAMGPGGMISFGHAAWFGLGAYAAALSVTTLSAPLPVALLAAICIAGLVAGVFAAAVVRLSGVYLAMLTLAFAQVVWAVATQWTWLSGGDDGILGLWPANPKAFFVLALSCTTACLWLIHRIVHAPFGLALVAVRDNEARAKSIGLTPAPLRIAAFALSGAASGLSGGLAAFRTGSVFPSYASVGQSVDGLLMVLLGGLRSVADPIAGAIVYTGLHDALLQGTAYWRLVLGLLIVIAVRLFPDGLTAGWHRKQA
ncbi:MAG TPA: ABC transporter permease [Rhodopila sp.]|nr:ABC transporter permease [Rhodopila sp.]